MEITNSTQSSIGLGYGNKQMERVEFLNQEQTNIFLIVNHAVLSGTVCLVGIVTNIINVIVFIMLGLDNSMNESFLAMAISDLGSLITLEWVNINMNPLMEEADVPFEPSEITYLTGGWPHACFNRITACITVYVTFERCLAVTIPLKVKQIITPLRTRVVICSIFLFTILALIPEYLTVYLDEKFVELRNETRIGLIPYEKYSELLAGITPLCYGVIAVVSFCLVILFTAMLVVSMKRKIRWRHQTTCDQGHSEASSIRDKKAMSMVVLISTIFIVCFTPSVFLLLTLFLVPEFTVTGKYANIFFVTWSFAFLAEAINSSVNIFLYIRMNSRYRVAFFRLFRREVQHDLNSQ